jgi:hypothetical protein
MPELSSNYQMPFPLATDAVNVHGDIKSLVAKLEEVLPSASYSQVAVTNESGSTITVGTPVYIYDYTDKVIVKKATQSTTQPVLGLAKTEMLDGEAGIVVVSGVLENVNTTSFSTGAILFVGESGGLTDTRPSGIANAVGMVGYSSTKGVIIIDAKGNGTWGALRDGLS